MSWRNLGVFGIVAGNVKDKGIQQIEQHGIRGNKGDRDMCCTSTSCGTGEIAPRLKLPDIAYEPCHRRQIAL
jgi:hypothetical protein